MRIDAHQHFWAYDAHAYPWIQADVLKRDYLPADLQPQIEVAGIEGTVAVQARSTWAETAWLLELANRFPWIVGVVGWADLTAPDLGARLASVTDSATTGVGTAPVVGVRCGIERDREDGDRPSARFVAGMVALTAADLAFDLLMRSPDFALAYALVAAAPDQRFIVDHIAKPAIGAGALQPWASGIRRLAAFPNVACKLSGMVTEADPRAWRATDFTPFLDVVLEAFGPERLMIGSDWPVCRQAAEYEATLDIVRDAIAPLSSDERAAILGMTATRWYGLRPDA